MKPDPVPVVVVGAGRVARAVHLRLLRDLSDLFTVVGVVDRERSRAIAAAACFPGAVACVDLDEALATGSVAVLCATPWYTHADIVLRCLRDGLHVLCEKPVTIDRAELDELIAAERVSPATVAVGYMKRHDPAVRAVLDRLRCQQSTIRQIVVRVIDPNSARQVRALLPPGFEVADSSATQDAQRAIDRALAVGDSPRRNAFAHAVGGSLVHHINLVHRLLDGSGLVLGGSLRHATHWSDGRSVTCGWRPAEDLGVQLSYVRVPDGPIYSEIVECVTDTGVLTLSAGSPYAADGAFTLRIDGVATEPAESCRLPVAAGFAHQLGAWAVALTSGGPALPGLLEARRDLAVVHEVIEALD
jgi:predicted dehydrogenase